jgi:hypothetical protein
VTDSRALGGFAWNIEMLPYPLVAWTPDSKALLFVDRAALEHLCVQLNRRPPQTEPRMQRPPKGTRTPCQRAAPWEWDVEDKCRKLAVPISKFLMT